MVEEESHSTAVPSSEEPELKFHEHARDFAVKQIRDYGGQLIRESVETAKSRRHALVLQKDVSTRPIGSTRSSGIERMFSSSF